ncbi:MAG: hypothetical protein ACK44B_06540 [Flavobacteriales bacterium]
MRILLIILTAILPVVLIAQGYLIDWSDMENSSGSMMEILPRKGKNFYALRYTGGAVMGTYKVSNHSNFKLTSTGKIMMKVESGMANFEGVEVIGGKLIVFLSDKREGINHIYMQEYSEECVPFGPSREMASYVLEKNSTRGSFNIISSRNKAFFGLVWEIPGRKEEKDRYGFKILDDELSEVSEGDYKLPFRGDLSLISEYYLSNTGDYFISVTEYSLQDDKKIFKGYMNYKAMHILHITPEGINDFRLDLKGKRVEAMSLSSDNDRVFTITGIYGEIAKAGVLGLFYLKLDYDKQAVIDEGSEEFSKDFIVQDWSERDKERAERREAKGWGTPQLYSYVMRQTEVLGDGSIVGSLEQYYVQEVSYNDPRTAMVRTYFNYYYNDIIVFKVNPEGGYSWLKKINKYQVSTNDGGPYSSYARFLDQGKLCFIFNDHIKNYDDTGFFIPGSKIYPANFTKKNNVVSIVKVNIIDGSTERKTFFDRKEIQALAVPKLFQIDYRSKEMLFYAVYGKKERFGLLSFKD